MSFGTIQWRDGQLADGIPRQGRILACRDRDQHGAGAGNSAIHNEDVLHLQNALAPSVALNVKRRQQPECRLTGCGPATCRQSRSSRSRNS
jgi:hypothetical protein